MSFSLQDAFNFPIIGSVVLFSLFLLFKYLPKDLVNTVLSVYFVVLGTLGVTATLLPVVAPFVPATLGESELSFFIPKLKPVVNERVDVVVTHLEVILGTVSLGFAGACTRVVGGGRGSTNCSGTRDGCMVVAWLG
jgi:minor histocompatibility antigen H13